jgi:hypothetical protein
MLLYRLHRGLRTAWQVEDGYLLFHENGVDWNRTSPDLPGECWAFTNSSNTISSVCSAFFLSPEAPVVQVTPPQSTRWKEFAKQQEAELFVMDIWSVEELTALL